MPTSRSEVYLHGVEDSLTGHCSSAPRFLEFVPQAPWDYVRYVRFDRRASPSSMAWREIEVFARTY